MDETKKVCGGDPCRFSSSPFAALLHKYYTVMAPLHTVSNKIALALCWGPPNWTAHDLSSFRKYLLSVVVVVLFHIVHHYRSKCMPHVWSQCVICAHTHIQIFPPPSLQKTIRFSFIARPIKKPQSFLCKVACAHCLLSRA